MREVQTPDDEDAEIEQAFDRLRATAAEIEARRLQVLGLVAQWIARPKDTDEGGEDAD